MLVEAFGELRNVHVKRPALCLQVLQVRCTRVRRPADDVHAADFIARELFDRVRAEVWIDSGRVHRQRGEDGGRVRLHRVAHVAALGVEEERRLRRLIAQLEQRRPSVGAVLLPERAVGLVAADVLLGLAHDLAAVPQRSGSAALDAFGVGVEADAKQRPAVFGEPAQAVEVAHRHPES